MPEALAPQSTNDGGGEGVDFKASRRRGEVMSREGGKGMGGEGRLGPLNATGASQHTNTHTGSHMHTYTRDTEKMGEGLV